jgi:hypothetical protein
MRNRGTSSSRGSDRSLLDSQRLLGFWRPKQTRKPIRLVSIPPVGSERRWSLSFGGLLPPGWLGKSRSRASSEKKWSRRLWRLCHLRHESLSYKGISAREWPDRTLPSRGSMQACRVYGWSGRCGSWTFVEAPVGEVKVCPQKKFDKTQKNEPN